MADIAERRAVTHLWHAYQKALEPFIRMDEREKITDPPPNLLLDPYQGNNRLMTLLTAAVGRTSEQVERNALPILNATKQADGSYAV
jgi:hypothetical protein